ncbi:MAG TPA: hypothetical protein VHL80_06950, partial [Polyangia bacterium]|nr:hypothetical protein [Polyangia bacterium]
GAAGAGAAGTGAGGAPVLAPFTGFGPNVLVFDPSMKMADIQAQLDAAYMTQMPPAGQFATTRFAYLFKPGAYSVDVNVAYYTQMLGLGASPDDVTITGAIRSMGNASGNATLSFWRAAENAAVVPTNNLDVWAVSQGASFRRMHVKGNLNLADTGTSSGGFIADSVIDGTVTSGSQQQYFTRNTEWKSWTGGVWNMVFVGVPNAPAGAWPAAPYTVVAQTPLAQEKPFLTLDAAGKYAVALPPTRANVSGASWTASATPAATISLDQFYVARAGRDGAAEMNLALSQGKHLLLEPGIYHLEDSLRVTRSGTIVMGLGLATLAADTGAPAITVAEVDGVKLAGLIVDAGATNASTLIQVGAPGAGQAHAAAPTWLYDLSCRVGGGQPGTATTCLTIDSGDVVGDNLWLWRADHGVTGSTGWTVNPAKHGLVVNGNDVTMYGLFVEHFQDFQTLWNGDGGRTYFYQSEMPYDPPSQDMWTHDGVNGYASYKVADAVTSHEAWGVGVYSAFRQAVVADDAVETPAPLAASMHHLVTVWLNGMATTAINHVINGTGAAATTANRTSKAN